MVYRGQRTETIPHESMHSLRIGRIPFSNWFDCIEFIVKRDAGSIEDCMQKQIHVFAQGEIV